MIDIESIFDSSKIDNNRQLEHGISLVDDLNRWINNFNKDLKLLDRSKNTLDSYNFTLNAFREYCTIYMPNKTSICDVEVNDCNDFLLWMENYETNKNYGSLKERMKMLADFLSFSKEGKKDFIEAREDYFQTNFKNREKVEYALCEFEDYYYTNEIPLRNIDNNYIVNYIETLPKASVATMMNRRAALHKFFTYITEETETECFKDVLKKMKKYKKQNGSINESRKVIDEEITERFLDLLERYTDNPKIIQKRIRKNSIEVAYRDAAMILLMYRGGLRVSEALNTRLCDIQDMGDLYKVNILGGKGNKNRTTYFKKEYFEKYYNFFAQRLLDGDYLSGNKKGDKMDRRTLYIKVKKLFEKLKEEGSIDKEIKGLHIFRHLFGSEFAEKNGNMKILQDLLGHSVITTTMIYSDVGEKSKQKAIML
ncbi:tyrosine-type recombinase/integrase [Sulfurimonas sp.]